MDTHLIEFSLASEPASIGVIAVTVDPGDTDRDAVIAVHNGYAPLVAVIDGKRTYRTGKNVWSVSA
jgi:hypothetical protein